MSALTSHAALLRLVSDEEIEGDFVLVLEPLAYVDEAQGLVVPFSSVLVAAEHAGPPPEDAAPAPGGRHKVSVDGEPGAWTASCACGGWSEQGPDKSALLDLAEEHLAAQRKR